ncbi:hypothetical protein SAPIO_CDS2615 [Scedosporium apiospermum]|uniref:Uncharacterized protein n=1 Tax=Pseudallescheria apiosperma TaxID=563466 RepID=A0A084GCV4_PSEDA|nr:uncharacterized protein SAPIO_CDS2615 [Scedosporium apiospermum]KEZ45166.1 hypothetical protein SAPIO_CDS2615 [Scedosporium apiospermum]
MELVSITAGIIRPVIVGRQIVRSWASLGGPAWREADQIAREFEAQSAILQDTLEVLLYKAIAHAEIDELLSDPANPKWQSSEINEALKQRLGEFGNEVIVHHIQSLPETLKSLEESIRVITEKLKGSPWLSWRVKWALMQKGIRQALQDLSYFNRDFRFIAQTHLLHESIQASQGMYARQAIQNVNDVFEKFHCLQVIAQNAEAIATGEITDPVGVDDAFSLYSVETEAGREDEAATLSFLALSLEAANGTAPRLEKDALLDTGATACAISVSLARELQLDIEEDEEEREVHTAALNLTLRIAGKAQVKMRWKDSKGVRCGTKIWVYVVYGLCQAVLLSHDFIYNHPEVWHVARKVIRSAEELQVLWFKKRSAEDQKTQQGLRAKRLEENRARADASSPRAAGSAQSQGSSSPGASVAGSSSTSDPALALPSVAQSTGGGE